jgi:hypothetical protein
MGRLVLPEREGGQAIEGVSRGLERPGPCDRQDAAVGHDRTEPAFTPLAYGGRELRQVDGRCTGVGDQVHPLHAVEKGEDAGPGLRAPDVAVLQDVALHQPRGPDTRLFGPAAARFR